MEIVVLSENTAKYNLLYEHGLSLLIKADKNILFDTGQSSNFITNAKSLGEDIANVDICFISHAHNDHGGGLKSFLDVNTKAKIYLMDSAFSPHYSKRKDGTINYIGLEKGLNTSNFVRLTGDCVITKGIETMSNVTKKYPLPVTNGSLYLDKEGKVLDDFNHEHNLVLTNKKVLIVGCAHTGIKNILEHYNKKYGTMPSVVIGGFHLSSRTGVGESDKTIEKLANYLLTTKARFYTCHCTGETAYQKLKSIMKDRIEYICTGTKIEL